MTESLGSLGTKPWGESSILLEIISVLTDIAATR